MKFRRDDGDLIPVWVLNVVNALLQFLNAHDAHGLVPLVAALKIVRHERDVHVVLPQLVGRFALAVPHERDHGAAVPVAEETQHHVQRALRVHAEHFLHPEHVLIELHTAIQINGVELKNRIATETLDAIRRVVPKNFPVSVRINGAEGDFRPNGKEWDMNYMQGVAKLLVAHGADVVNVSMGGMDCMPNPDMRARYRDDIIQNIKNVVDVPVAAVNCLKTPEEAEGMLADGVADMAILGRQLICDPEWANKAKAGREDGLVKSRIGDTTAKAAYDGWYQSVYVPAVETAGTEG